MTLLLLDTNVVLWLAMGARERIPEKIAVALADLSNEVMVSAATFWEIAIKRSLGKLEVADRWPAVIHGLGFTTRPVTSEHAVAVERLPWLHRDPFDRLLVAQAQVEGAVLVSADARVREYPVSTWWE